MYSQHYCRFQNITSLLIEKQGKQVKQKNASVPESTTSQQTKGLKPPLQATWNRPSGKVT